MKLNLTLLAALLLTPLAALHAAEPPILPTVDISGETSRHVIVAQGSKTDWQGHPHTVLLPDGKTMFCVWQGRQDGTSRHGAPGGLLKRSDDGGLTWSELLDVPANWKQIGRGGPTIHRLVDATGVARLFVYCRDENRTTFLHAMSADDGKTWSPMRPLDRSTPEDPPITGWTAPISILEARGPDGRRKHLMWYERNRAGKPVPGVIWQSASYDGGLTWGQSKPVVDKGGASEPAAVRSPDGKQILLLIRENSRQFRSLSSVSNDEGATWSVPKELPLALTGDRHLARYAPDGRLVIVFRPVPPRAKVAATTEGLKGVRSSHCTAWVGRYEDLLAGGESGYLVKLLHSHQGADHTYPGLELLPDGTFVATTYIKYREGPELHSVVSVRFKLVETDTKIAAGKEHVPAPESAPKLGSENKGERLYNGIVLPEVWPPAHYDPASPEPMPVPYLEHPPSVIPIDVGRQLFVDDFLIAETTLTRAFHKPERYAGNPVLKAETPQETEIKPRVGLQQGGLFYNDARERFELFYHSGKLDPRQRHLAFSQDLIHWERPDLGTGFGNLIREPGADGEVLAPNIAGSVFAIWLDTEAADPSHRYKMLSYFRGHKTRVTHGLHTSPDGVHWSNPVPAGPADDDPKRYEIVASFIEACLDIDDEMDLCDHLEYAERTGDGDLDLMW